MSFDTFTARFSDAVDRPGGVQIYHYRPVNYLLMAARVSSPHDPPRGRVLVVDDVQDMAESNALMLRTRGLDTVIETDPETAFERVDESVACVVSDYQMPEMNGLELLDKVREEYPQMPFILFTGRGSEEVASDAIEAGVDHYLQKGGAEQYDRLANCVENTIEQSHVQQALRRQRKQFRAIYENAFDGIFILDLDETVIVDANPRACELLGYPEDELIGTSIETIHPDDFEEYLEIGKRVIENDGSRRVESVCYTRGGEELHSDITTSTMEYAGKTHLLTIMRPK